MEKTGKKEQNGFNNHCNNNSFAKLLIIHGQFLKQILKLKNDKASKKTIIIILIDTIEGWTERVED